MYEDMAQSINGDMRGAFGTANENWTPILKGTSVTGTFTYTHQVGWALRQGLLVDCWYDVAWTGSGTAAGNLYVELPYEVASSNQDSSVSASLQTPFVGVVQSSTLAYTGGTGIVLNAIPNTFRGEFWNVGTAFATANQAVVAAGRLIGHVRYLGHGYERP